INANVSAIVEAAREQSTGLKEINQAVNSMDQATQQNAAMVEESTAASHAMAREAEALHELLRQFRYGERAQVVDANRHLEDRAHARAMRGGQRTSLAAAPAADGWQNF
ncbi:Methyl-accepting chemotaxis protein (MCP) signalling domain-containing protein, partial [Ensifer sp. OV372]